MTTKAELIAEIKTTNSCECTNCKTQKYRLISLAEQLPDTPNPFAGIELYAPIPAGRKVIGIRVPKKGDVVLFNNGNVLTATMDWRDNEIRIILAPLPPPTTWACPGLKDKAYEVSVDGVQFTYNTWLPWSDIAIINSKLTKPEHFGVYDVVNEVGTLREGGLS